MSSIGAISGMAGFVGLASRTPGAPTQQKQEARPNTSGLEAALRQAQAAESQAKRQLASAMSQHGSDGPEVTAGQAAVSRAGGAVRDAQSKLDASKQAVDIVA